MLKTIIFDCDGVMFDSQNSNRHYYNSLLTHFGFSEMNEDELHYVHIHSVYDSVKHIFRNYPQQSIEQVHEYRRANSYLPFLKHMDMEPDLLNFLEKTRDNYNLAIATNRSDTMMPLLKEFKLEHYFGKVMTADNSPRPKPAADPLLEIIKHFDCMIGEAIYIGDSTVDEETAKNCGMRLIAFKNDELDADYHVESFTEILKLPVFAD
ncbi:HAD family hydrolase [Desulfosediminicola sp.]|uniref:HAD family hydrolase n=1 Tax=Desulfosediminicola sp. TaxID=2886825 RepID=UPI003AF26598